MLGGVLSSRCMGFHLQRALQQIGVQCVEIAPSSIARAPGDRVKTDRRDAVAIARLLRNGEGERVHVPSSGDEAVRDYLRCREDVHQELRRYRQRMQHTLIRHGHVYRGGRNWTQGYRRWLDELQFSEEVLGETVQVYYRRIQELEEKLGLMDLRIQELASSVPYAEPVARLRCFRGIDFLTALAIVVGGGRLSAVRERAGVHGLLGAGTQRAVQRIAALVGSDHQDWQRPSAAAAGRGSMALPAQLCAEQDAARPACGDAGGADGTHCSCRAAPGTEVRAQHRAPPQAFAGGGHRGGRGNWPASSGQ